MWLIVGLGNPSKRYESTRHNLGARVVEALRETLGQPTFRTVEKRKARVSRGGIVLAIPTTYMNDSGRAVAALVPRSRWRPDRLLVVHDDKDLAFGQMKLQKGRSSAGHRGVQSIIDRLGSAAFWRLRLGIGTPALGVETDAFVLQPFTAEEEQTLREEIVPTALSRITQHTSLA